MSKAPISQQDEAKREIAIRALEQRYKREREDFSQFVKTFYQMYYNREFVWNWHYDQICRLVQDLYEGRCRLAIINVPPQSGKTEIITKLFPIWCMGRQPYFNIISTGYSASLTTTFSEQSRNYYQSSAYRKIFPRAPELTKETADNWGTGHGFYKSAGVGGSITGKPADLFIIDDPLNPHDVYVSGNTMEKVNNWFSNVAMTRLSPVGRQLMLIIMQRLHDNDLCGYLERTFPRRFNEGVWRKLVVSAEKDEKGNHGSFFPKFFPLNQADNDLYNGDEPKITLQERRENMTSELGANYYSAQFLQDPVDIENAEFKREYFRYFKETDLHDKSLKTILAVDPALSEKQSADKSAISVISVDEEGNFYRRASFAGRVNPDILIEKIFQIQSAFNCPVVIEDVAFQRVFIENVRKMMAVKKIFFEIRPIKPRGNKEVRISTTLGHLYKAYKIFHLENDKFSEFEEELTRFPKGRHDDEIDAMEMAISQFKFSQRSKWIPSFNKSNYKPFSKV